MRSNKRNILLSISLILCIAAKSFGQLSVEPMTPRSPNDYLNEEERKLYYDDEKQTQKLAIAEDTSGFIKLDEQMKQRWASKNFARYSALRVAVFAWSESPRKHPEFVQYSVDQVEKAGLNVDPYIRILSSCQYINYSDINTKEERDEHTRSTAKYLSDIYKQNATLDDSQQKKRKRRASQIDEVKDLFFVPSVVARLKKDYGQAPFDLKTLTVVLAQLKQALPQDAAKWDDVRDYVLQRMKLSVEGVSKDPFPPTPATMNDTP